MHTLTRNSMVDLWEHLGKQGFTVSVVFGPLPSGACQWSVDVLTRDGQSFERPYLAESLEHAIEIALLEIRRRGWYQQHDRQPCD